MKGELDEKDEALGLDLDADALADLRQEGALKPALEHVRDEAA